MNLSRDIIIIIFNHLVIIDQRSWIRCNKQLNQLYPRVKKSEKEFLKLIHESKFLSGKKKINLNKCEIYALETIYYGRKNLLERYLKKKELTILFTKYYRLYRNMVERNPDICKKLYKIYRVFGTTITESAASSGNLKLVKWMKKQGCHIYSVCNIAAENGHIEIIKWARENGYDHWIINTCVRAAFGGHLEVLKWLQENKYPWNSDTCSKASLNGHFEVLKWARENGCPWDKYTCIYAARAGNFEILKWARENGCTLDSETCHEAALNGDLEMLKWARENPCAWSGSECVNAVKNGDLKMLKWIWENGFPEHWYISENKNLCDHAFNHDRLEIFQWLQKKGVAWNADKEHEIVENQQYNLENEELLLEKKRIELDIEKKRLDEERTKIMKFNNEMKN